MRSGRVGSLYDELYFQYCQRLGSPEKLTLDQLRRFPAADVMVDHARDWLTEYRGSAIFPVAAFDGSAFAVLSTTRGARADGTEFARCIAGAISEFFLEPRRSWDGAIEDATAKIVVALIRRGYSLGRYSGSPLWWTRFERSGCGRTVSWRSPPITANNFSTMADATIHLPTSPKKWFVFLFSCAGPGLTQSADLPAPFSLLHLAPYSA